MSSLNQEKHNHSEKFIFEVSWRTQKVAIDIANEGYGLAFFSMDLGLVFENTVGNDSGVMLRGKGPHKPDFA